MTKTKTLRISRGKFQVVTTITHNKSRKVFRGQPKISFEKNHVQIGCMRFTRTVLFALAEIAKGAPKGLVLQKGDYDTNDPNAKLQ